MSISIRVFILCTALLFSSLLFAQPKPEIKPKSFQLSARLFAVPDEHVYPFDQAAIAAEDKRNDKDGHMPRFARFLPANISLGNSGTWTTLPNGDRLWRVKLSSPGALALIPCYDDFFLPPGAMLHVYSPDRAEVRGAFTSSNNPRDGNYNTGLIYGESCIIEYYEPAAVAGLGHIHLSKLGHAYRLVPGRKTSPDFGAAGPCEVNVKCPEGDDWQDQKNSSVVILVIAGTDAGWCSGALVNNANQDCTPYVLSADHCYQDEDNNWASPSASDLSQWLFFFQYESSTCANPASEGTLGNNFMTGCTFTAASLDQGGSTGSDFSLLRLNSAPPLAYIPYYAGWSNIDIPSINGVGIHHPSADITKISTYVTPLISTTFGGITNDTHWQIGWSPTVSGWGVTEPGSSGSPIFNAARHIVGTLTGGNSSCSSEDSPDYYGKFSYHWESNGAPDSLRLQPWLDPDSTGIQTLDGVYAPCSASLSLDAAINAIAETGTYCDSNIAITCTLTNYGSTVLTSDSLTFNIDNMSPQGFRWTGSLSSLQSVQVSLPVQDFPVGSHTVTITSSSPNGGTDGNPANDSYTSTFSVAGAVGRYSFSMQVGDQGTAISWELTDIDNHVLYTGGPYSDSIGGQLINQTWCLPESCYIFTVFSSAGDGLSGINTSGTYTIRNANGTVVSQLQDVNFGLRDSVIFCQGIGLGIANVNPLASISIYPNPSSGLFNVCNAPKGTILTVTDVLGREVLSSEIEAQTQLIDMGKEESGIYFFRFTSDDGSAAKKVILNCGK